MHHQVCLFTIMVLKGYFYLMRMGVLPACAWYPWRLRESIGTPGTGIIVGCALLCGCWESSPGCPKGHQGFLTPSSLSGRLLYFSLKAVQRLGIILVIEGRCAIRVPSMTGEGTNTLLTTPNVGG